MTRPSARPRGGFTLIELLVVIGLIAGLAAIVMAVAPGALEKDRAVAAVTQLEGALQISRAKAVRDNLPRGVRLLVTGGTLSTEYQYIESPPVYVPNPLGPSGTAYVQFEYTAASGPVTSRTCRVVGLTTDQASQVTVGSSLYLPTLGTWHEIVAPAPTPSGNMTVTLDAYPDTALGAQTRWRTYHFGMYAPPRPLLGEPNLQLPQRTAVDLAANRSLPSFSGGTPQYDILFAPGGSLIATPATRGAGHVFLWVRDPNRPSAPFEQAGEQMLLVIKGKTGAIGAAPVDWGSDPYSLGRRAVSGY